ncbi:MAG: DNA polymerase III, subunit gamma and tau [Lentisphaerae bacterium RIFOXYB12_FULL_65_16]|nr:MAG: DNA polymerase III, subunit gamma and tau [Lentisphaerae bacterium RIFOXYA12_64_32]OGV93815.1 MAG: DNA polymerase III, subunit gamma and tau [Lentisphaerae bacterium RIFOXYB12_FULL_65_16]
MAYQVLARKWRPQTFADVVGQEHITQTLQNAISRSRVGHAYLFVGPRGIGKTTSARIFAKALNCEAGGVPEPCCQCQSCREITAGSALDVIEIDGASHNKVEDIRDIRDNVQYTPARSRYKIYIIDEVHMLSPAAWNALLKTLEEPPAHVKFLFATTEPHKVLPTILSRCQRFDLKRIPVSLIAKSLRRIADAEKVRIDDRALAAIARAADGGMRDAQSIFDQMISFCGTGSDTEQVEEKDVIEVFGLASGGELIEVVEGMFQNDLSRVFTIIQSLADRGRDLERLYGDLVVFVRDVMICATCQAPENLLEVSDSELTDLQRLARSAEPGFVQRVLQGLIAEDWAFRSALNKRISLEAALARIITDAHSPQIDDVVARLNELRGAGGAVPAAGTHRATAAAAAPPSVQRPPATPPPRPAAGQGGPGLRAPPAPAPRPTAPAPAPAAPSTLRPPPGPPASADRSPPPTPAKTPDRIATPPPARATPTAPPPAVAGSFAGDGDEEDDGEAEPAAAEADESPPLDIRPDEVSADEDVLDDIATDAGLEPVDEPARLWHRLIEEVDRTPGRHQLRLYMQEFRPVSFRNGVLHVAYDEDVPDEHIQRLMGSDNMSVLQKCFERVSPTPHGRLVVKKWLDGVSSDTAPSRLESTPEIRRKVEQNPFVHQVCKAFRGTVVDVRG